MSTAARTSRIEIPIDELCKRAGVKNPAQLARKANIPARVFSDIKSGKQEMLSRKILLALADATGASAGEIIIIHPA